MLKKPLFAETFFVLLIMGLINYIATRDHLYWKIAELDSLVHFLGGVFVSLFFLWLYFFSGFFNPMKRDIRGFLIISVMGMIFVGVLWEAYEIIIGEVEFLGRAYPYDTILDFAMDILGSLAACFYAYIKEMKLVSKLVWKKLN